MAERIGFIGLGIMGKPMCRNLLKAGYDVWVYSRREDAADEVVELGAKRCFSPVQVAENSDVVITLLTDSGDVQQVVAGENGLLEGAAAGSIIVDMSTILPSVSRELAETCKQKQVQFLDAPVSGGESGAINGTLSIMVGGEGEAFDKVLPIFKVLGENIVLIGDSGAGQVAKTCNQMIVAQTLAAVAEAFVLAKASGVEPARVREALLGGFAASRVLEVHGQRILERNFNPGFKASLHQKDLYIALQAARELGVALPATALVSQYLNAQVAAGHGDLDSSVLALALEQLSQQSLD